VLGLNSWLTEGRTTSRWNIATFATGIREPAGVHVTSKAPRCLLPGGATCRARLLFRVRSVRSIGLTACFGEAGAISGGMVHGWKSHVGRVARQTGSDA
jgi:hypothetical protein